MRFIAMAPERGRDGLAGGGAAAAGPGKAQRRCGELGLGAAEARRNGGKDGAISRDYYCRRQERR
jgi:hypothetical protein